ncbi:MAG: GntP family permease [Methanolinea sp.]|jgi:GntP family gluconate:H+ symporter|nr:GntP family permease [Methanolinea sp.]
MSLLVLFLIVLLFLAFLSIYAKTPPFLSLLAGAIVFGMGAGMDFGTVLGAVIAGLGRVFALFAIIIFSGAVIGLTLQAHGHLERMVSDLRAGFPGTWSLAAIAGYIFSLLTTCCITAFVMLAPVIGRIETDRRRKNMLLFLTATGSVISYTLVFPTPVIIPLLLGFGSGLSPLLYDLVAIPLSLALLAGLVLLFRNRSGEPGDIAGASPSAGGSDVISSLRAWAPFIAILVSIPLCLFVFSLSHESMIQAIMLAGLATALLLAPPEARSTGLKKGTAHAGLVMFDICGAGALGNVILESGFADTVFPAVSGSLPAVLIPFAFTAIVQAALGSRVATSVIASQVMAGTALASVLEPLPLVLSVAAGVCIVSWLTDPFFWLLHRTTGATIKEVSLAYTLPLAACGAAVLFLALGLHSVPFPA